VADALGTRPGTGLNALPVVAGVSIDVSSRFVPENCSSPSTDRVTMDTTMWLLPWRPRHAAWWRRPQLFAIFVPSRHPFIAVARHFEARSNWRAQYANPGRENCRRPGSVGKPHERDPAALLGAKLRVLKSQETLQRVRSALTLFPPGSNHQAAWLEMGNVSRSGELAGWRRLPAGRWGCDACFAVALEFFSSVDEICACETRVDRRLKGHHRRG